MTRSGHIVGRETELAEFDVALAAGMSPIVISGDAGIGKTRFIAEVVERLAGRIVLVGGFLPLSAPLPLLPVIQALRELSRRDEGDVMRTALKSSPTYVRRELARLLPELVPDADDVDTERQSSPGAWERERLFAAMGDLLREVARGEPLLLIVEDAHWADKTTLDFLTFLRAQVEQADVAIAVTCRADEVLADHVRDWLGNANRPPAAQLHLGGLTRDGVFALVASLLGDSPCDSHVDDLYRRTAGNPLYVEQVVAAGGSGTGTSAAGLLPAALAELLSRRVRNVSEVARRALTALAVLGRPASEQLTCAVSGLSQPDLHRALRELSDAKLLAERGAGATHATRHALLAEAVLSELLQGERRELHARAADALERSQGPAAAAEAASHWREAARPVEELRATAAAAAAAASVFAYTEAAPLWIRAIELEEQQPVAAGHPGIDPLAMHLSAAHALRAIGRGADAGALLERAYPRFAGATDMATTAEFLSELAYFRRLSDADAALVVVLESLRMFESLPSSAGHAAALRHYATLLKITGAYSSSIEPLGRAIEIAESVGATGLHLAALSDLALATVTTGNVAEGLDLLARARALVPRLEAARDDQFPVVLLAIVESDICLKIGLLERCERVAVSGIATAQRFGGANSYVATVLASNAVESLLELGLVGRARTLLSEYDITFERHTSWMLHLSQVEIDVRDGRMVEAQRRLDYLCADPQANVSYDREISLDGVVLALWRGRPEEVLPTIRRSAARGQDTDEEVFWGELLVLGARAAADLAEQARARRDRARLATALGVLEQVEAIADRMGNRPFADHPYLVRIPSDRAAWHAERERARGRNDPVSWSECAELWEGLGRPHRAAYAWWRCAEAALMARGRSADATAALRRAAELAIGMVPLQEAIGGLATRARITLEPPNADGRHEPAPAATSTQPADPYGLTDRELAVLGLVAAGRTNSQIGTELFISPKTASVHVTNILRKLEVDNRTQAAAVAERAGLLAPQRTSAPSAMPRRTVGAAD